MACSIVHSKVSVMDPIVRLRNSEKAQHGKSAKFHTANLKKKNAYFSSIEYMPLLYYHKNEV